MLYLYYGFMETRNEKNTGSNTTATPPHPLAAFRFPMLLQDCLLLHHIMSRAGCLQFVGTHACVHACAVKASSMPRYGREGRTVGQQMMGVRCSHVLFLCVCSAACWMPSHSSRCTRDLAWHVRCSRSLYRMQLEHKCIHYHE